MTFAEMRTETEVLYEFVNSANAPGFTDAEWGTIFTAAQRNVVYEILKEGIAANAKNQIAISYLITSESITTAEITTDGQYYNSDGTAAFTFTGAALAGMDNMFFWILDEYVSTATSNRIRLNRISFDHYQKNLDNPYAQPNDTEGYWILSIRNANLANSHRPVIITDGTTPTGYEMMGVKHPDQYPIDDSNNCLLNESIHSDIVKEAVALAKFSVDDPQGFQLALLNNARN
jgi:hypothetical protein